jgi:outer membrane protein OmpA-like peptidoglycan-associated protein
MSARGIVAALVSASLAGTPTPALPAAPHVGTPPVVASAVVAIASTAEDGIVRGTWVSNPATAVNPSGGVRDITAEVRDVVTEVRSLDDNVGVVTSSSATTVTVQADVLFDFDQADLTPAARAKLDEVVQELRTGDARGTVIIGGHADGKGTAAYNQALSDQRASAVATALTPLAQGLDVSLQPRGYGDTQPVAPNLRPDGSDNPEGRAKNRRVTVTFTPRG